MPADAKLRSDPRGPVGAARGGMDLAERWHIAIAARRTNSLALQPGATRTVPQHVNNRTKGVLRKPRPDDQPPACKAGHCVAIAVTHDRQGKPSRSVWPGTCTAGDGSTR